MEFITSIFGPIDPIDMMLRMFIEPEPGRTETFQKGKSLVYLPTPAEQWKCGSSQTIKWLKNDDNAPEMLDIELRVAPKNIISQQSEYAFTLYKSAKYSDGEFSIFVDCTSENRFEDGLNYYIVLKEAGIQPGFVLDGEWSISAPGAVWIREELESTVSAQSPSIWDEFVEYNIQFQPNIENLAWVMSHTAKYDFTNIEILDNTYGAGEWSVEYAFLKGTVSCAILRSLQDNVIVVVFRPTTGSGIDNAVDDWSMDFAMQMMSCDGLFYCGDEQSRVHKGFMLEYLPVRDQMVDVLFNVITENMSDCPSDEFDNRILFTGMSQGGGLAQIAALDMKKNMEERGVDMDRNDFYLMTYGSPPSGNKEFAMSIQAAYLESHRERFVHAFNKQYDATQDSFVETYAQFTLPETMPTLVEVKGLADCMLSEVPDGATPIFDWVEGPTLWHYGDMISGIKIECDDYYETGKKILIKWLLDERFTVVENPSLVHVDADNVNIWPGINENQMPNTHGKGPTKVYSNLPVDDLKACDIRKPSDTSQIKDSITAMSQCHDLVGYAKGISESYTDDGSKFGQNLRNEPCETTEIINNQENETKSDGAKPFVLGMEFLVLALVLLFN